MTYIEFLGVENHELAEHTEAHHVVVRDAARLLPEREILSRVVLRTDDIEGIADSLRSQGLELSPILDGERLDATGNLIQWRMFMVQGEDEGLPYPFFIQWKGTDEERANKLTETGVIRSHPAGDVTLYAAVFGVRDPQATSARWQELFGLATDEKLPNTILVGEQQFIFEQADEPGLKALTLRTDNSDLQGEILRIGEGAYRFIDA